MLDDSRDGEREGEGGREGRGEGGREGRGEGGRQGGREEGGLVDQRASVYDGDEFDVFRRHRDIDLSQVHIGKRCNNKNICT